MRTPYIRLVKQEKESYFDKEIRPSFSFSLRSLNEEKTVQDLYGYYFDDIKKVTISRGRAYLPVTAEDLAVVQNEKEYTPIRVYGCRRPMFIKNVTFKKFAAGELKALYEKEF